MGDGKAQNTFYKMHGSMQLVQPHQLLGLREFKEHGDFTDVNENWTWHHTHKLILMETLKEMCCYCLM